MPDNNGLQVVFGTGAVGAAVIKELASKGKRVRAINRSGKADLPDGVEVVSGDASDPASTTSVCEGASVVYNCANPGYTLWAAHFPPIQAGIIEGAASAGAKLVSAENVYMYGPVSRPMTEDLPYAATTRKGRLRAQMAEALMEAHESGKVRVAIGRVSDYFGPGCPLSAAGERVFYPALEGKKVSVMGKLDVPHTYTFIGDFARGLAVLGERDEALGEVWHIPSAETLTTREWATLVFEEAGHAPDLGTVPNMVFRGLGLFVPMMRELAEMLYEFEEPFTIDHSKYARAFGADVTPHREAIRLTLDWYRQNPKA